MTFFDFRKRVKNGVAILLLLFWPPTRGVGSGRYLRHPLLHWLCPQRRGLGVSFAFSGLSISSHINIYITESTQLWIQLRCKVFDISALIGQNLMSKSKWWVLITVCKSVPDVECDLNVCVDSRQCLTDTSKSKLTLGTFISNAYDQIFPT